MSTASWECGPVGVTVTAAGRRVAVVEMTEVEAATEVEAEAATEVETAGVETAVAKEKTTSTNVSGKSKTLMGPSSPIYCAA